MRKNRRFIIILAVALLLLAAVTVYAAVRANITIQQKLEVGDVKVVLHQMDENGAEVYDEVIEAVCGYSTKRVVYAENTGDQTAFVRIRMQEAYLDNDTGNVIDQDVAWLMLDEDAGWLYKDGWYYYSKVLEPGTKTTPLTFGIQFDTSLNASHQNDVFEVEFIMQGLQAKNNAADVMEAEGWPEE